MGTHKFNTEKIIKEKIINHEFKLDDSLWASMDQKLDQTLGSTEASLENNIWGHKWMTLIGIGLFFLSIIFGTIYYIKKQESILVKTQALKKSKPYSEPKITKSATPVKIDPQNRHLLKTAQNNINFEKHVNTSTSQKSYINAIEKEASTIKKVNNITNEPNFQSINSTSRKNETFSSKKILQNSYDRIETFNNATSTSKTKGLSISDKKENTIKNSNSQKHHNLSIAILPRKKINLLSSLDKDNTAINNDNYPLILTKSKASFQDLLYGVTLGIGLEYSRTSYSVSKIFPDLLFNSTGKFASLKPGIVLSMPIHKRLKLQAEAWYKNYNLDYELDATYITDTFNIKSQISAISIETLVSFQINIFKGLNLGSGFGYQFNTVLRQNLLNYEPNFRYSNLYNQIPTTYNNTVPFYDIGVSYHMKQFSLHLRKRNYYGRFIKYIVYEANGYHINGKRGEVSMNLTYYFKR